MSQFQCYTGKKLSHLLNRIRDAIYTEIAPLQITGWCTPEPLPFERRLEGMKRNLTVGDKWGNLFDCAWFHFTGTVPESAAGKHVVVLLDVNGEMCLVDSQGVPLRGLTNLKSLYDYSLGGPGKRVFEINRQASGKEKIDLWADAGCNDLFGYLTENGTIKQASIALCNDDMRTLFYDFEVLLDLMKVLSKESARHQQIFNALNKVGHLLSQFNAEEARAGHAILLPQLQKKGGDASLQISAIGHAHLDLAWMWPIRESIRKGARTFATVLYLMERYPDYIFGASQPQLFDWMKQYYPELYQKIKAKVHAGRIEAQGAMWVEADTNISGGEALVRQILHGKRFFKQEFGVDPNYLWLPDVFGYSAALPQLLKKSGVDYFMTQKLSWSLINNFPYHSFHWQGIDGTTVLTHMLPEETYNSAAAPHSVHKAESQYREKAVSEHCLMLYGIGDGGGGPGAEHLERLTRQKNLNGICPVVQETAAHFLAKWAKDAAQFPRWVGELYLERHQGTFTTNARNKWYNRKIECALRELEWVLTLNLIQSHQSYPTKRLEKIWREVLLYQFHDILPGSSIKRVYDESIARYQQLLKEVNQMMEKNYLLLTEQINTTGIKQPLVIFNSLSWERTEWIKVNNQWFEITVPACGYQTIDATAESTEIPTVIATENQLENDLMRVTFATDGSIQSIYDKRVKREVIASGQTANKFAVYADDGDAWDFRMDYADFAPRFMELVSALPRIDGPQAILEQTYRLGHSELVQAITLTAGSRRIDFNTQLNWRETETMLRTAFPVAIHAEDATYEIQFGHVQRPTHQNTSWDLAKDEVPAQKWGDLSARDYGVALLNDSKYGYKIKGNVIDLNLLRSVLYSGQRLVRDEDVQPGEPHHAFTDQCEHTFTYSLFPHPGDHIGGGVVQAGYELNHPLKAIPATEKAGSNPTVASFIKLNAPYIILETVKKAEDSEEIIVRLYEAAHRNTAVTIHFSQPVETIEEANLMEESVQALPVKNKNEVKLEFQPFEIKTLKIKFR